MRSLRSPNCGPRRDGLTPTLVVLHYTAMVSAEAAIERLCDPEAEVSAHYVISRKGDVSQLVSEDLRAWHAGAGEWHGLDDINSRSIGIELDNDGRSPFSEPLMSALEVLLRGIMQRHGIPPEGVIGHSDMAPGRKFDPGAKFDWQRLARQSLAAPDGGVSVQVVGSADGFRDLAKRAGFTADVDDEALLQAVRLRHRPWGKGHLSEQDFDALRRQVLTGEGAPA